MSLSEDAKKTRIGEFFPDQYESPRCFVCGPESPTGLKLRFKKESENSVSTSLRPRPDWTGWGGIMHGGFQSLLLDETMSWTAHGTLGLRSFVTRDLKVRFLLPVDVNQQVSITGFIEDDDGRYIQTRGELRGENGRLLTTATATIVRVDPNIVRSKDNVDAD